MGRGRIGRGHEVPALVSQFEAAIRDFSTELIRTAAIQNTGDKGSERESSLRELFNAKLPKRYSAAKGEVVDLFNNTGPQLDILIYDQSREIPFYTAGIVKLPAEALLASVEVKSVLNASEVDRCVKRAAVLKKLKPFKRPLVRNNANDERGVRYFHAVFAYDTDLGSEGWLLHEHDRFSAAVGGSVGKNGIDLVYVLKRGLLNLNSNTGMIENERDGRALFSFYFSILNFIDRESRRRKETPYMSYAPELNRHWQRIR